jgi:asparagine synthase (glutamine-hydrolysing)
MSIVSAVVTFADAPGLGATARDMLAVLPRRMPDGLAVAEAPGAALGMGKLVVSAQQGHAAQPLRDAEAGLTLVADARIDNRDDLRAELGLPAAATDAELILAGYRRHGPAVVKRLIGDFALIVWDERRRTLFAARDPFGVRPLVHCQIGDRLLLASDPEQIVAVEPRARVVDDDSAVDFLLFRWTSPTRTFFRPIANLPAGHQLHQSALAAPVVQRWWWPERPQRIADPQESLAEFRRVFSRAVTDRLRTDHPALVHLSGGFDSTAIALMAGQAVRGGVHTRPVRAVGAVHPGLSTDEAPLMHATAARLPFPLETWDGTKPDPLDLETPHLAGPCTRVPRTNGTAEDLRMCERDGARVILAGLGGDSLHPTWDVLRDLLAERRLGALVRATLGAEGQTWKMRRAFAWKGLKVVAPARLRAFRQSLRQSAPAPAPAWLAPAFHAHAQAPAPPFEDFTAEVGAAGAARLREFARPLSVHLISNFQRAAADAGAECRAPFLDTRVAAAADRVALSVWRPPYYRHRLHALAFADVLPPELRALKAKIVFTGAVMNCLRASEARVRARLSGGALRVDRYLTEPGSQFGLRLLAALTRASRRDEREAWTDSALVWSLATLEAWLRIV